MGKINAVGLGVMIGFALAQAALAAPKTFTGTGDWNDTNRWTGTTLPADGDDVTIDGALTLTNATPNLSSYLLKASRTQTIGGTNSCILATNVVIYGTLTHNPNTDTNGTPGVYSDWTPDNWIWIQCTNLTVATGGGGGRIAIFYDQAA